MRLQILLNFKKNGRNNLFSYVCSQYFNVGYSTAADDKQLFNMNKQLGEEQFRVMQLVKKKLERKKRTNINEKFFKQPRAEVQSVNQDWGNVWPGPRTYHPATVPLPVRMGFPRKNQAPPDKFANAELMKIPNFLHLTPPVIERQCAAIKKFCTPWPKELESDAAQQYFYPVVVTTSSYVQSSPSLRDPRARVVTLTVPLDSLKLDVHACDKLLRLVGDRFDPKTRLITLAADRCPLSSQNLDYCRYLLTVLYNESLKTEPWEHEKEDLDFEYFLFERSKSKQAIEFLGEARGNPISESDVEGYKDAVTILHNEGENVDSIDSYKDSVLKLLKLKT